MQGEDKDSLKRTTCANRLPGIRIGFKGIHESTKRAASLKAAAKKLGVKVTNIFWTLGEYDGLLILDAPDDEAATTVLLHLAELGHVHTTTKPSTGTRHYRETLGKLAEDGLEFKKAKTKFVVELGDLIDAADTVETEQRRLQDDQP